MPVPTIKEYWFSLQNNNKKCSLKILHFKNKLMCFSEHSRMQTVPLKNVNEQYDLIDEIINSVISVIESQNMLSWKEPKRIVESSS